MNAEQKKRIAHEISNWRNARNDHSAQLTGDRMSALLQEMVDAPEPEPVAWMVKNGFVCSMIYRSKKDADNYAADQQKRHDLSGSLASFCVIPLYTAPPEPKPVARVTGYYAGYLSIATVDGRVLPAGTALYAAPPHQSEHHLEMVNTPAPSVPDGLQTIPSHAQLTQILNGLDRCVAAESKREFLRVWIRDWTVYKLAAAPTPAEPPADVARDAERLDWLLRNLPWFVLRYCVGVLSDTSDGKEFRDAIDAAIKRQGASDEPRL